MKFTTIIEIECETQEQAEMLLRKRLGESGFEFVGDAHPVVDAPQQRFDYKARWEDLIPEMPTHEGTITCRGCGRPFHIQVATNPTLPFAAGVHECTHCGSKTSRSLARIKGDA